MINTNLQAGRRLAWLRLPCKTNSRSGAYTRWDTGLDVALIYFQQALCAVKGLFQGQIDFILDIPPAARTRWSTSATPCALGQRYW